MIVGSAVKFVKDGYPIIIGGKRHCDCYNTISEFISKEQFIRCRKSGSVHEGFITNDNRFLEREAAAQYAYSYGQITIKKQTLFSEDLW